MLQRDVCNRLGDGRTWPRKRTEAVDVRAESECRRLDVRAMLLLFLRRRMLGLGGEFAPPNQSRRLGTARAKRPTSPLPSIFILIRGEAVWTHSYHEARRLPT